MRNECLSVFAALYGTVIVKDFFFYVHRIVHGVVFDYCVSIFGGYVAVLIILHHCFDVFV